MIISYFVLFLKENLMSDPILIVQKKNKSVIWISKILLRLSSFYDKTRIMYAPVWCCKWLNVFRNRARKDYIKMLDKREFSHQTTKIKFAII